ncbi:hypothetical protein GCM10011581_15920 [Saccharopolyspora subtropica]|uniref:MerR family transcriptional regulator n=1 Tax=Saccharopolyspora thermophila TaxID=89367 RepID=A0A917JNX3_9PSEU|nr:MerR family transcriptional regulator [Saccharopolyspora subtropica]GGI79519.1 hypothetical protein GCM10011581_15920 [Saccharopolyspora subtropica]
MSIGDLAGRFGLATHVLRHWESVGLLSPERVAGRRRYGPDDLYRVAIILRAKEAGLGLDAIREMFATKDPIARRGVMRQHRDDLRRRIDALRASLELVECALECEHVDVATCPHFRAVLDARIEDAARTATHPGPGGI